MERRAIYTREDEQVLIKNGRFWNFHEESTQEHLHSLHPYPAKFIPQIPRKAIEAWSNVGDLVYDPFAGCGTTLLEASLLGRLAVGTDNNPVAVLISKAKVAKYTDANLKSLIKIAAEIKRDLPTTKPDKKLIPDNENFAYWFDQVVLDKLSALKSLIITKPEPAKTLLLAVFSSIIVRVSFQDSDTRYAKINRITKPEDVGKVFLAKLKEVINSLPEVITGKRASAKIYQADARKVPFIKTESVSLIVTSPPYLNAYDYHKYHRQRIHWIDGSVEFARDLEIGSHDEFTRKNATPEQYFKDMDECFSEWARVMRVGARCLIVIGDSIVSKKPVHVGDKFVDLFVKHGIELESRKIRTLHSTKRAFNVKNSRITHEHLLLFKKVRANARDLFPKG
jgi:site-specific DNA-methyltransferase (cytosine-N4-specific)